MPKHRGRHPLLVQAEQKLAALSSLSAEVSGRRTLTDPDPSKAAHASFSGTLRLQRPNLAEVRYRSGTREVRVVADGSALWQWEVSTPEYTRLVLDPTGKRIAVSDSLPVGWPVEAFFQARFAHIDAAPTLSRDGAYQVVEFRDAPQVRQRFFIADDGLVHRYTNEQLGGRYLAEWELHNLRTTPSNTPFTFTPSPGTRERVPPPPPTLLKPGTEAPDFTVETQDGRPLRLSSLRGKVVVLDFWAVSCGPCLEAFPHNNAVAKKFGDDVVFLALHVQDSRENFQRWLTKNPQYTALRFALDPAPLGQDIGTRLYKVPGLPTLYVIGKDGKITRGFLGFAGPTPALEAALLAAGGTRR